MALVAPAQGDRRLLYYLGTYLQDHIAALSFLRLLDSISFRALGGAITAMLFTITFGGRIILALYSSGRRDKSRSYDHFPVTGKGATKTYGGPLVVASIVTSVLLWGKLHNPFTLICLFAVFWFVVGAVFFDSCSDRCLDCLFAVFFLSRVLGNIFWFVLVVVVWIVFRVVL